MDKKISLKIDAAGDGAVREIQTVEAAQDRFKKTVSETRGEVRKAKAVVGDVKAYEQMQSALKHTAGDLEYTANAISALNEKTLQKNSLTDEEVFKLDQHKLRLDGLNQKLAEKGQLTEREKNQRLVSQRELDKLMKKRDSNYQLTVREQKQLDSLTKKLSSLTDKEKLQTSALSKQEQKLSAVGISTRNLAMAKDIANRRAEKSAKLLKRENDLLARSNALQDKKRAALASMPSGGMVGLGILAAGGAASVKSMDNESNFVDVAKNFSFADGRDKKEMRNELNRLAVEMAGVKDSDVMAIAAGGANGGIAKEDIATYTKDTIKTATAWDMTAEDSARKGMALRNSLGYADGEAGRDQFLNMANMINDVANKNGGVNGRDLLGVMSRSGADLINKGFTESGALGLSGALLSKGSSEEEAATATRGISRALAAGFAATGSQQKIFGMLGMDSESVAESMQDDAMGTLTDVLESIKELDATEQSAAISQLFGEEAAPHVQKLLKDTKTLRKIQQEATGASKDYEEAKTDANKQDSITKEYSDKAETYKSKYEQTTDSLSAFAVVMGDRLLPIVEPLREGFTDVVISATEFLSANEGVGTAIAAGAAIAVTAAGAYKAYQAVKFAKGLIGIAKETAALKKAQSATDRHTAALERNAKASSRAASSANERGGSRRQGRGRSRSSRKRSGRRNRLGNLLSDGVANLTGGFDAMPDKAPHRKSRRRKGGLLALGAGLMAGGMSIPAFASGMDGAADATGVATDAAEALPFAKAAKAAKAIRPVAMVMDGVSAASSLVKGDYRAASETGGGFLGGMGGAALGGLIGSFILPGIGTAIGAALGGMAGDEAGSRVAGGLFDWASSPDDKPAPELASEAVSEKPKTLAEKRLERRRERRRDEFKEHMSLHPNYRHLADDVKRPSLWYKQYKLKNPTPTLQPAQEKELSNNGDYRVASESGGEQFEGIEPAALGGVENIAASEDAPKVTPKQQQKVRDESIEPMSLPQNNGDYRVASESGGDHFEGIEPAALGGVENIAASEDKPKVMSRRQQRIRDKFKESMSQHPNYRHLADDVEKPSLWYSQAKLNTPTEAIKTAQAKEVQARQTPNQTFAPQIIIQAAESPEETAQLTMEKIRELWDEWQSERDEGLNQDLTHSLVT